MNLSIKALDHVALHVADVELSVEFYTRVLGLELLTRPAFDFPGAWFRLGGCQELHLVGERSEAVVSGSRSNHFALEVTNIADWEAHIKKERAVHRP
ncbi:MAG: VOC family protein, partial [Runella sp.]